MRKTSGNGRQRALDLGVTEVPIEAMRAAYARCRLDVPFERSLDVPYLRICLRNVVLAGSRRVGR